MRLLVDAQLPPLLAVRMCDAGHQVLHVFDRLPPDATDADVAAEADRLGSILVSKDEDFVDLAVRGILTTQLLWVRCGNMTTVRLWRLLEPLLPEIERSFAAGERIVEIR